MKLYAAYIKIGTGICFILLVIEPQVSPFKINQQAQKKDAQRRPSVFVFLAYCYLEAGLRGVLTGS
jgi:hypothetical protein